MMIGQQVSSWRQSARLVGFKGRRRRRLESLWQRYQGLRKRRKFQECGESEEGTSDRHGTKSQFDKVSKQQLHMCIVKKVQIITATRLRKSVQLYENLLRRSCGTYESQGMVYCIWSR